MILLSDLRQRCFRTRPDIKLSMIVDVIQDAARQMCIETCYARDFVTVNVSAKTPVVVIGKPNDRQINKIHAVEWFDGTEYFTLAPLNQTMASRISHPNGTTGKVPEMWSEVVSPTGDTGVALYATPSLAGAVRASYSYIPEGDFDSLPIKPMAELAIFYLAQAMLREMPGDGMNFPLAEKFRRQYQGKVSELIVIANFGISGNMEVAPQAFGG